MFTTTICSQILDLFSAAGENFRYLKCELHSRTPLVVITKSDYSICLHLTPNHCFPGKTSANAFSQDRFFGGCVPRFFFGIQVGGFGIQLRQPWTEGILIVKFVIKLANYWSYWEKYTKRNQTSIFVHHQSDKCCRDFRVIIKWKLSRLQTVPNNRFERVFEKKKHKWS